MYINDYLSLSIYFCIYYAFENVDVSLLILACGLINILNLNLNLLFLIEKYIFSKENYYYNKEVWGIAFR